MGFRRAEGRNRVRADVGSTRIKRAKQKRLYPSVRTTLGLYWTEQSTRTLSASSINDAGWKTGKSILFPVEYADIRDYYNAISYKILNISITSRINSFRVLWIELSDRKSIRPVKKLAQAISGDLFGRLSAEKRFGKAKPKIVK